MTTAPIVLFAYNRPELLEATLESLSANELASQSSLFIFCDGPKEQATPAQLSAIRSVREVAHKKKWCGAVSIIEAEKNKGLATSVITGVTDIVNKFGKIIVVEDDVLLSRYFLRFMNDALGKYGNNENVLSIGSWNYFCPPEKLNDNFFLRYPDSIAWATFQRAWNLFEPDGRLLLSKLREKNLLDQFNCRTKGKYFENMLINQVEGKISSWAIRWTATSVLHNKLNFYPRHSLSKHMGFTKDATHESDSKDYNQAIRLAEDPISMSNQPVMETKSAIAEWKKFVVREFIPGKPMSVRIKEQVKKMIPDSLVDFYRKNAR